MYINPLSFLFSSWSEGPRYQQEAKKFYANGKQYCFIYIIIIYIFSLLDAPKVAIPWFPRYSVDVIRKIVKKWSYNERYIASIPSMKFLTTLHTLRVPLQCVPWEIYWYCIQGDGAHVGLSAVEAVVCARKSFSVCFARHVGYLFSRNLRFSVLDLFTKDEKRNLR